MSAKRPTAREVLSRLRWEPGSEGLDGVEVVIVHRGAPGDRRTVRGEEITDLGKGSFGTPDATIPYHRVIVISRGSRELYRRAGAGDG